MLPRLVHEVVQVCRHLRERGPLVRVYLPAVQHQGVEGVAELRGGVGEAEAAAHLGGNFGTGDVGVGGRAWKKEGEIEAVLLQRQQQ